MAKPICQVCGQTYRGIALFTVQNGREVEVCPACYKTLDAEYRKNSCLACVFFHMGNCELFGTELDEPYVQSARCEYFTTSKDAAVVTEMKNRAAVARKAFKEKPVEHLGLEGLIAELGKRGQMLTYFCCHCGTGLKIGAKQEIQKTCPNCKRDLSVIDLEKLISQHL